MATAASTTPLPRGDKEGGRPDEKAKKRSPLVVLAVVLACCTVVATAIILLVTIGKKITPNPPSTVNSPGSNQNTPVPIPTGTAGGQPRLGIESESTDDNSQVVPTKEDVHVKLTGALELLRSATNRVPSHWARDFQDKLDSLAALGTIATSEPSIAICGRLSLLSNIQYGYEYLFHDATLQNAFYDLYKAAFRFTVQSGQIRSYAVVCTSFLVMLIELRHLSNFDTSLGLYEYFTTPEHQSERFYRAMDAQENEADFLEIAKLQASYQAYTGLIGGDEDAKDNLYQMLIELLGVLHSFGKGCAAFALELQPGSAIHQGTIIKRDRSVAAVAYLASLIGAEAEEFEDLF